MHTCFYVCTCECESRKFFSLSLCLCFFREVMIPALTSCAGQESESAAQLLGDKLEAQYCDKKKTTQKIRTEA